MNVIAHRGASRLERENTVAAFRRAVALGADGVELDVRRTADETLVVHHDALLDDGRAIVETPEQELPQHVARLDAALDAASGVVVNVEIKNATGEPDFDPADTVVAAVAELLAARAEPAERWLVSSFRMETIDRLRALAPHVRTAFLTVDIDDDMLARVRRHGHAAVHPWVGNVTATSVAAAHALDLLVNTWTCNDPDRAVELAGWGVDGLVTDVPDVILAALAAARRSGATPA